MDIHVWFVRSPAFHPISVDRVRIYALLLAVIPSRIAVHSPVNVECANTTNREG